MRKGLSVRSLRRPQLETQPREDERWLEVLSAYGSPEEAHEPDGRIRVLTHRARKAIARLAETYEVRASRSAGVDLGSEEISAALE